MQLSSYEIYITAQLSREMFCHRHLIDTMQVQYSSSLWKQSRDGNLEVLKRV